jgi:hypothetical protein
MSISGEIFWDDGRHHVISDASLISDRVNVDVQSTQAPGTRVDVADGGAVLSISASGSSVISMSGGQVLEDTFAAVRLDHDASLNMSGGEVVGRIDVMGHSTLTIEGGEVNGMIDTDFSFGPDGADISSSPSVSIAGGSLNGELQVSIVGDIHLFGTTFYAINRQRVSFQLADGSKLSEVPGTLDDDWGDWENVAFVGRIAGTLSDGSALDIPFTIVDDLHVPDFGSWTRTTGDITVHLVPEPSSLSISFVLSCFVSCCFFRQGRADTGKVAIEMAESRFRRPARAWL